MIILAPHVDDEVIGCFRLLLSGSVKTVIYFFDLDEERKAEALESSKRFGFIPISYSSATILNIPEDQVMVVPHISDNHPHHKWVNQWAKQWPNVKLYYSVDMDRNVELLSPEISYLKQTSLKQLFPSQLSLFENAKYYLFESKLVNSDYTRTIGIRTQFEGIHCYPHAPDEVAYLRNPHRHIFHVLVTLEVFHDDREVEFIMFKHEINKLISEQFDKLENKSCEMIADMLLTYTITKYKSRSCKVTVSEDNENEATLTYIFSNPL